MHVRWEDISGEGYIAWNAYRAKPIGCEAILPLGIIRQSFPGYPFIFKTLFDTHLPNVLELTEIAEFMRGLNPGELLPDENPTT